MTTPFNAGVAIGQSGDSQVTGPLFVGAVAANATPVYLPPGWTIARTPLQAVGWYRITHNLNLGAGLAYAVFGTTRNNPKAVAMPTNYQQAYFDINTTVLPSAADTDLDFAFILIAES
jgi:hypothetical protein